MPNFLFKFQSVLSFSKLSDRLECKHYINLCDLDDLGYRKTRYIAGAENKLLYCVSWIFGSVNC